MLGSFNTGCGRKWRRVSVGGSFDGLGERMPHDGHRAALVVVVGELRNTLSSDSSVRGFLFAPVDFPPSLLHRRPISREISLSRNRSRPG